MSRWEGEGFLNRKDDRLAIMQVMAGVTKERAFTAQDLTTFTKLNRHRVRECLLDLVSTGLVHVDRTATPHTYYRYWS